MKTLTKLIALTAIIVMSNMTFADGDALAGKSKSAVCAACHGTNGIGNFELWPNLAGQKLGYLIKAMKEFRDGKRTDPSMAPVIKTLSDQDVEDIAAYYNSL